MPKSPPTPPGPPELSNLRVLKLNGGNLEILFDADGTHYEIILGRHRADWVFIAWPAVHWSTGCMSDHAPPNDGWLHEQGVPSRPDARNIAAAIQRCWATFTAKPEPQADAAS